jgi:predicted O-methyltransferase YrrM
MSDYTFTKDWFHWAPEVWEQLVPIMPERSSFLEIGSFEGRSAIWIAEHMAGYGAEIVCVDTWEGGEEHKASGEDMVSAETLFDTNIRHCDAAVTFTKIKSRSYEALASLTEKRFDFVYIDGSHVGKDVLTDACMAWPLLKAGGIMVFDDYLWGPPRDALHRPKLAIDAFINIFGEEIELRYSGYQLIVSKAR